MKRRTDTPISAQKLFEEAFYTPLYWPWKMVRLERKSLSDYQQRSMSANISVAELYHENSKLFPQMLSELTASLLQVDEFRREFARRRAFAIQASSASDLDLGQPWRKLLTTIARTTEPELFYAVEVRIAAGGQLAIHEPVSDTLQVVKQFSVGDLSVLRRALRLMVAPEAPPHNGPLLFIVCSFARNDLLFGPRGYRRSLLEAGRVMQEVLRQARRLDLAARPLYEFTDRDLDAVLEVDGIEEGTLIAIELGGSADVR